MGKLLLIQPLIVQYNINISSSRSFCTCMYIHYIYFKFNKKNNTITSPLHHYTLTVASSASHAFSHTPSLGSLRASAVKISNCDRCSLSSAVLLLQRASISVMVATLSSSLMLCDALTSTSMSVAGPGSFLTLRTTPSACSVISGFVGSL